MATRRVYIDESGRLNPGSKTEKVFVFAAVSFSESSKKKIDKIIEEYKMRCNIKEADELKFHKLRKDYVGEILKTVNDIKYSIYIVVFRNKNVNLVNKKENLYLNILNELLSRMNLKNTEIVIDGSYGVNFSRRASSFLRKNSKLVNCKVKFVDSRKDNSIQFVDIVAGAVARSYSGKKDAMKYQEIFESKIKLCFEI